MGFGEVIKRVKIIEINGFGAEFLVLQGFCGGGVGALGVELIILDIDC